MEMEMSSSSSSFSSLSNDTMIDIFSQLPLNDLVRIRRVCKSWCSLTTKVNGINENLIVLFTCPSHSILLSLNCDDYYSNDSSSSSSSPCTFELMDYPFMKQQPLDDDHHKVFQILGSCNGLLCIQHGCDDNGVCLTIYLWNPSTKQFKTVPEEPIDIPSVKFSSLRVSYKFGCNRTMDDYKLIRTVKYFGGDIHLDREVKIYTLRTNSWRRINEDTIPPIDKPIFRRHEVHLNGAIHWISNMSPSLLYQRRRLQPPSYQIVSFDIEDEKYQVMPKPKSFDDGDAELHVLSGCLCISYRKKENHIELWMMKDYGVKESWTKLFKTKNPILIECWVMKLLWLCKNGKILIKGDAEDLLLYDPDKDEAKYLRIDRNYIRNWTHAKIYIDNTTIFE